MRISRPQLKEVDPPKPRSPRSILWIPVGLTILAITAVLWVSLAKPEVDPERLVDVTELYGRATVEGASVTEGRTLDRRPVIVPAGSRLTLTWPSGHEVVIEGPANGVHVWIQVAR